MLLVAAAITPEELYAQSGIELLAYAPVDEHNKIARKDPFLGYSICAFFSKTNGSREEKEIKVLVTHSHELERSMKKNQKAVDNLVNKIEARPEGDTHLRNQLLLAIKFEVDHRLHLHGMDEEKRTGLLSKKYEYIHNYLLVSQRLQRAFRLPNLFSVQQQTSGKEILFSMHNYQISNIVAYWRTNEPPVFNPIVHKETTTIDREDLLARARQYPKDPSIDPRTIPQYVRDAYEICQILGISLDIAAVKIPTDNPFARLAKASQRPESSTPAVAVVTLEDVAQPSPEETVESKGVTHAQRRRSQGSAVKSGFRSVDLRNLDQEIGLDLVPSDLHDDHPVVLQNEIRASVAPLRREVKEVSAGELLRTTLGQVYEMEGKEQARIAKREVIKLALTMPKDEREKHGVYLVGIGPNDVEGNIQTPHNFSQYEVHAVFNHKNEWKTMSVDRASLAEETQGVLATFEELVAIDQYVTKENVWIWEEGTSNTYNRQIAELESIDKLQGEGLRTKNWDGLGFAKDDLEAMQLAWLASTLAMAKVFQVNPDLSDIMAIRTDTNKKNYVFSFRGIIDTMMPYTLFGEEVEPVFALSQDKRTFRIPVALLQKYQRELADGRDSERNQDAVAILQYCPH